VGQLAAFLAKIFASKKDKKELCCGIELEEIDEIPVSAGKDPCACSTSAKTDEVQPRTFT
jgi:hypothetical protein